MYMLALEGVLYYFANDYGSECGTVFILCLRIPMNQ